MCNNHNNLQSIQILVLMRKRAENHNIVINMVMETTTKSRFMRDFL